MKKIVLLLLVSLVQACTPAYKSAVGLNTAELNILAPSLVGYTNANVFYYEGDSCIDTFLMTNFFPAASNLYLTRVNSGNEITIRIDFVNASPDYVAGGSIISNVDEASISFTPKRDATYELSFPTLLKPILNEVSRGEKTLIAKGREKGCWANRPF